MTSHSFLSPSVSSLSNFSQFDDRPTFVQSATQIFQNFVASVLQLVALFALGFSTIASGEFFHRSEPQLAPALTESRVLTFVGSDCANHRRALRYANSVLL